MLVVQGSVSGDRKKVFGLADASMALVCQYTPLGCNLVSIVSAGTRTRMQTHLVAYLAVNQLESECISKK